MIVSNKKSRLPAEYQEVKYIESTGTQYFIIPKYSEMSSIGVEFKCFIRNRLSSEGPHIISSANGTLWLVLRLDRIFLNYNNKQTFYSADFYPTTDGLNSDIIVKFNMEGQGYFCLNEQEVGKSQKGILRQADTEIWLLDYPGRRNMYGLIGKFYYCKLYNDGQLFCDFIPCYRKLDGEIGLYDLVENKFYTNQGTGEFLKGGNV